MKQKKVSTHLLHCLSGEVASLTTKSPLKQTSVSASRNLNHIALRDLQMARVDRAVVLEGDNSHARDEDHLSFSRSCSRTAAARVAGSANARTDGENITVVVVGCNACS